MSPSMSMALTFRTKSAPRYYRCRTKGCSAGQVSAKVVEDMVPELIAAVPTTDEQQARLEATAGVWNLMWPYYRRRALLEEFRLVQWNGEEQRLFVEPTGMPDIESIAAALAGRPLE